MPSIIQNITLQGVPQATEQLKTLQTASVQTAAAINEIGATGPGGGVQNVFVSFGKGADEIKKVTSAAADLKLGLRTAKPIISDLGGSFGDLGNFAKLAAASLPLFAVAFAGKTLIDLTKFNEQLLITKDRLDVITHGPGAFNQVAADAARLGIPIGTLAGAVEDFANAWQKAAAATSTVKFVGEVPPGAINSFQTAQKIVTDLVAQFQAAGVSSTDAAKAIKDFSAELGKTGTVTGDMIRKLAEVSPRVAENLAKMFGFQTIQQFAAALDKVPLTLQRINLLASTPKWVEFTNPKPVTELTGALIELGQKFEGLKAQISPTADAISVGFIKALNVALDLIKEFGPSIATMLSRFTGFDVLKQGIAAVDWQSLADRFQDAMQDIEDIASQTWDAIKTVFNDPEGVDLSGLIAGFQTAFQTILQDARSIYDQIKQAFSTPIPISAEFSGPPGGQSLFEQFSAFGGGATGGLIRGPGTGTSDSILARVSSGEFLISAAATSHWGASFLAALNNMRMPNLMPQSTLVPRFAEGGPVTAPAVVNLHFGTESFALQASEGVAQALRKHAVRSRLVSTGRKPSWY